MVHGFPFGMLSGHAKKSPSSVSIGDAVILDKTRDTKIAECESPEKHRIENNVEIKKGSVRVSAPFFKETQRR
jgi:hypothetical protein